MGLGSKKRVTKLTKTSLVSNNSDGNKSYYFLVCLVSYRRTLCSAIICLYTHMQVDVERKYFRRLSNDPCKVDSNFLCYVATGLSPHRNVIIFTQRMHKPIGRQLTQ